MITTDKMILGTGVLTTTGQNLYVNERLLQTSFSKSAVLYNQAGISSSSWVYNFPIWRAMANCTVTGISALMISGTCTGVVNVRKNFISGHLVTDMRLTSTGNWFSSGLILNSNYSMGETLEARIYVTGGVSALTPTSITVQVDFIK